MRSIVAFALALGCVVVSSSALAQNQGGPTQGAQGQQGQAGQTAEPKKPEYGSGQGAGNMGGYSYDDKPRGRPAAAAGGKARVVKKHNGPVVNLPGFEQTQDGGSRVFVSLTSSVPVEEHKGQGTITYVLKGAGVRVWNNTNALVTVHFNTPVSKAKLVPHGSDAHLVIDLRAASTPTWKMTEGQDKTAVLQIDFPKGDFAPADSGGAELNVVSGGGGGGGGGGDEEGGGEGGGQTGPRTVKPAGKKKGGAPKPAGGASTKPGPTP